MAERDETRSILNWLKDGVLGRTREKLDSGAVNVTAPVRTPPEPPVIARPTFGSPDHPLKDGYPPAWATAWGDDRYGVWVEFALGEVAQRMRWIRPGRFMMGSPESEEEWDDEGPQHEVRFGQGYWLFDTPVTQALWLAVMGENPSHFLGEKWPVEQVSWDDAQQFLERINASIAGLDLVLPTEAQWEYACRAGTVTPNYAGGAEALKDIAWFKDNSGQTTHPVGALDPNAWGLYDMLGNVWEWCADGLRRYEATSVADPVGSLDGTRRALRGGSWGVTARLVRAAGRSAVGRDLRVNGFGFRCARVRE